MKRSTYLAIAGLTLVADQAAKAVILARFADYTVIQVIPGFFRLIRVENPGMAFGIFSDSASPWTTPILILFSLGAIALVGALLWQNDASAKGTGIGLALILGGAAGNLVDRVARGKVIDFLDFYVGSYHWPAFNIADSAICVGAGLVVWGLLAARPAHRPA